MTVADINKLISTLTLEEKASLCSGLDFWHTKEIDGKVPSVMVSDGPHGLRKQDTEKTDCLGVNDSIKAVCFPTACATASSFDIDLLQYLGEILGDECIAENVGIILGPAVNIKRSPLCGRNFEYFSEDPYLAGQLAAAYIKGVQSKGVGTSLKHFACNNMENERMTSSSELDERTLHEIYLAPFENAIKTAKPDTVMCSYNKINGEYSSENYRLLTEILRNQWGFNGFVMSDWYAVNDRVKGLTSGLELEMPSSNGITDAEIVKAVLKNELPKDVLDTSVERLLTVLFKYIENKATAEFDRENHHKKAIEIAKQSMVLLKNDGVLPLKHNQHVAFIGEFAKKPRFQGGGSSHINSYKVDSALEFAPNVAYAQGYMTNKDEIDTALLKKAVEVARSADVAVLFVGLPNAFESEGYDRTHMNLPNCQNKLITEVLKVQSKVVIVLHNGSPVEMPWVKNVNGILETYLCGEGVGSATVELLYGNANPCGKLAESFPLKLSDNPSYLNFNINNKQVKYNEGVFVGYRYYDKKESNVLFPFGYGLSYTNYEYSNLKISNKDITDEDTITVKLIVKNTGNVFGKEIVQLYVADKTNFANRPIKELKGFLKIALNPQEEKTVTFTLNSRSFAYYNELINDWYCPTGVYEIQIGKSSRDIVLKDSINLTSTTELPFVVTLNTTAGEILNNPKLKPTATMLLQSYFKKDQKEENEAITDEMQLHMMEDMPLRGLRAFADMTTAQIQGLVDVLNFLL